MILKKENYTCKGLHYALVAVCYFLSTNLFSQSNCFVRVASEPLTTYTAASTENVTQSGNLPHYKPWMNLSNGVGEDNKSVEVNLLSQNVASTVKFSNFNFNIPLGAKIDGIIVSFKGRREGAGFVSDNIVQLSSGNVTSNNFGGKGYNIMNVFAKSTTDKRWKYGFQEKNWGKNWTSAQINDPSFGVELQLINITTKEVSAFIDDVKIEVQYTPLPTFCLTDCFPVYTDLVVGASSYFWHIPDGFEMISRSERNNIIDFKVLNAQTKVYNVCVDAIDAKGKVIEQCCRDIRVRSCVPAKLGNFVWNDVNYNGLQDIGEQGVPNVKINLYNAANVLLKSTTTALSGAYFFDNLAEGNYYMQVDIPDNYFSTFKNLTNVDINSDFNSGNKSHLFNIQFGDNLSNIDFGLIKKLSIGNYVWEDSNYNGFQDFGEKGIKDVIVNVYNEADILIAKDTTDANGNYSIDNLIALKYTLKFKVPSEFLATKPLVSNDNTDSNISANNATDLISFQNKNLDNSIDAGFFQYGSVGDFTWSDSNQNGLQDTDEVGEEGLTIYLLNEKDSIVGKAVTEANGVYHFLNILPRKYSLQMLIPDFTSPTLKSNMPLGSDLKTVGGIYKTDLFTVLSGQNIDDIDLGYSFLNSSICGKAWTDADADGLYSIGEELLSGISVALVDESLSIIKNTLTDVNGKYCFDSLGQGNYKVAFVIDDDLQYTKHSIAPEDFNSDVISAIGQGLTNTLILLPGDTLSNIDAGIIKRSVVGDFVWNDINFNGIQDIGEIGIANIELSLYDDVGNVLSKEVTDENGFYLFQNILAGNYILKVKSIESYQLTKYGISDSLANNDFANTLSTSVFNVALGDDREDIDCGLIKTMTLGDFVWEDLNANGSQDIGENGIANMSIQLIDEFGVVVTTTISDENGAYRFVNIPTTKYSIKFIPSEDYLSSPYRNGDALKDSDILQNFETSLIDFTSSDDNLSIDAGFYKLGCIGDFAWLDTDEDGIQNVTQNGLSGVMVTLTNLIDSTSIIYVTDTSGRYSFCDLKPGKYIINYNVNESFVPTQNGIGSTINIINNLYLSDTIVLTSAADLNNIDAGFLYRPISKICGLTWADSNGDGIYDVTESPFPLVAMVLLDSLGNKIKKLKSDQNGTYCFDKLPPAKYYVRYYINDDHQFTFANIGDEISDSDAIGIIDSATTELVHLKENTDIGFVYAGISKRSKLGNFVWFDSDKNGLQDLMEIGIPGVPIALCNEAGEPIKSSVTDNFGNYLFDKIVRGNYIIKFPENPSFDFTLKDVDVNNGSHVNTNGATDLLTVLQNEDNLNIDAGYALKGGIIAGEVWQDVNKDTVRGIEDYLLSDINVYLYGENNILKKQTKTTANGDYNFYPVPVGNYYIKFDSTNFNSFVNDGSKIYADVTNEFGRGTTSLINVAAGSLNTGIDAGLMSVKSSIAGLSWLDDNGNGLLDTFETPPNKAKVFLYNINGVLVDSTFTNATDGHYAFDSLYRGIYLVKFDTISSNYQFTTKVEGTDSTIVSLANDSGILDTISLASCDYISNQNAGYRGFGSLKGEAFLDENENGINDENTLGINKVAVCLIDASNKIVAFDSTSIENLIDGQFSFSKIAAGQYRLKVRRPLYYIFAETDANNNMSDNVDSDVTPLGNFDAFSKPFNIFANSNVSNIDFGLIFRIPMISSISGFAWEETMVEGNRDTSEILLEGIPFILYDSNDNEISRDTTDVNGFYSFKNIAEGYYYVKATIAAEKTPTYLSEGMDDKIDNNFTDIYKKDATTLFYLGIGQDTLNVDLGITGEVLIGNFVWEDLNFDGLQSSDEPGLVNVEVSVYTSSGKKIKTTKTNANGNYLFNNLPQGSYDLKFSKALGYSATKKKTGNGTDDSCIDENCTTGLKNYASGMYFNVDAGLVKNASVGNRVWVDFNSNGLQNGGEPGKDSVALLLYKADGTFVANTTTFTDMVTGEIGKYIFKNLRPGDYYIKINTPNNFKLTLPGGSDFELNSDFDLNGTSQTFTLLPNENNTSIDVGIYFPGCIGNRVWLDQNKNGIQDEGESGVKDIEVKIYKGNGTLVTSGMTNEEGIYLFSDLTQGLYYAEFKIDLPYKFTILDEGTEATDNDANENGVTPLISLAHGAKFYDLDAGIYVSSALKQLPNKFVAEEKQIPILSEQIVSPNPALNLISINIPFLNGLVTIFDAKGKQIENFYQENKNQHHNISNYQAGVYYVNVTNGGNTVQTKFIKVD